VRARDRDQARRRPFSHPTRTGSRTSSKSGAEPSLRGLHRHRTGSDLQHISAARDHRRRCWMMTSRSGHPRRTVERLWKRLGVRVGTQFGGPVDVGHLSQPIAQ
jgi:hypothetical protein